MRAADVGARCTPVIGSTIINNEFTVRKHVPREGCCDKLEVSPASLAGSNPERSPVLDSAAEDDCCSGKWKGPLDPEWKGPLVPLPELDRSG